MNPSTPTTLILALAALVLAGCAKHETDPDAGTAARPIVYTVNEPLAYFARRIGGDAVDVRFPAPADVDPAFWRPDADTIVAYQEADLIVLNGAYYAKWIETTTLPRSRLLNTSAGFAEWWIDVEATGTHSHGPAGDHSHAGTAFTTWLDFKQAAAQARAIRDALVDLLPDDRETLDANFAALATNLDELDEAMTTVAAMLGDRPLVSSHPVYQYWSRRYGLNERSVMWEPETVPDERDLAEFDRLLAEHPATLMIWEGDPDPRTVELLATRGVRAVVFDPCGNAPDPGGGGFLDVMSSNLVRLREAASTR